MALIDPDFSKRIKGMVDIVKTVQEYVKLKKVGSEDYRGLCPFHHEKTPSFVVHRDKQFFKCFGCAAAGDIFTFVRKIEGCSFDDAVRQIADSNGIPLPNVRDLARYQERMNAIRLKARAEAKRSAYWSDWIKVSLQVELYTLRDLHRKAHAVLAELLAEVSTEFESPELEQQALQPFDFWDDISDKLERYEAMYEQYCELSIEEKIQQFRDYEAKHGQFVPLQYQMAINRARRNMLECKDPYPELAPALLDHFGEPQASHAKLIVDSILIKTTLNAAGEDEAHSVWQEFMHHCDSINKNSIADIFDFD
jgi:hypothetical protein